jgi:hypothetical protein
MGKYDSSNPLRVELGDEHNTKSDTRIPNQTIRNQNRPFAGEEAKNQTTIAASAISARDTNIACPTILLVRLNP